MSFNNKQSIKDPQHNKQARMQKRKIVSIDV